MKKVILGVFVIFAMAIGGVIGRGAVSIFTKEYNRATITTQDVERSLLEQKVSIYPILKEKFPSDFEALLGALASIAKSRRSMAEIKLAAANEVARIRKKYSGYILRADDDDLRSILGLSIKLHQSAFDRGGYLLCNELANRGPTALLGRESEYIGILNDQGAAYFEAVANAIARNSGAIAEVTESDWIELEALMAKQGFPDRYLDVISRQDMTDRELCPALIALMSTALQVSGESGIRLRASFVNSMASS